MQLEALLQQPAALPMMSKVVQELIDSFQKDDVAIDDIARRITADPVLSAKLLRLANSAYFRVSRSISTVNDAVAMLGFVTVRTLVVGGGLTGGFKGLAGVDLKQFWRYSLHTACVAKYLAKPAGQNGEVCFTIGLMHAIGQLVMYTGMPEAMPALDKLAGPLHERRLAVERDSFGYTYCDVGAELVRRWRFPDEFSHGVGGCGEPLRQFVFESMAGTVHLAAWRARAAENKLSADDMRATWPQAVADKLSLRPELVLVDMPPLAELAGGLEELLK